MNEQSTYVVPPAFEAALLGFDCVELTPRKAHLYRNGRRALSAYYKQADLPKLKRFGEWVTYIVNAQPT